MPIKEETKNIIFNKLKKFLEKLTPPLVVNTHSETDSFEVIGNKPVPYGSSNKIVEGMYFGSIAKRKDSVVFYFFPCYMNPKLIEDVPEIIKCLKGKTCFHFKREEQINEKELQLILNRGMDEWKKLGYVV